MNILIDSSVLIALHDSDDVHHQRSIKDLDRVQTQGDEIWITQHVLDEVMTILAKRNKFKQLKHLWQIIELGDLHIFQPKSPQQDWQIMSQTYSLLTEEKRKKASFTDLHQVILVKHRYLADSSMLSYDHHLSS
ncbi:MAG: type II toxin-antitoxin system VapC family toxin [Patescibacteria group bacterium]|nr:type II toxin-antitoxin system VapC family toxin [Patescibacteria group bacterium]